MGNASTNGTIADELRSTSFPSTDGLFSGIMIAGPEESRVHRGHRVLRLHHTVMLVISSNAYVATRAADESRSALAAAAGILGGLTHSSGGQRGRSLIRVVFGESVGDGSTVEILTMCTERADPEQRRRSGSAWRRRAAEVAGSGLHASTIAGHEACARVADLAILTSEFQPRKGRHDVARGASPW